MKSVGNANSPTPKERPIAKMGKGMDIRIAKRDGVQDENKKQIARLWRGEAGQLLLSPRRVNKPREAPKKKQERLFHASTR